MLNSDDDDDEGDENEGEEVEDKEEESDEENNDAEEDTEEDGEDDNGMDIDTAVQKIRSSVKEYFAMDDLSEAVYCFEELKSSKYYSHIVVEGTMLAIEAKDKERDAFPKLLLKLYDLKMLKSKHFLAGFKSVLEYAEDMLIDIPLFLNHTAAIASPVLLQNALPMTDIIDIGSHLKDSGKLGQLFELLIKQMTKLADQEKVIKLMKTCRFQWDDVLPETQDIDDWKKDKELTAF